MRSAIQEQKLTCFFKALDENADGRLEKADLDRLATKIAAARNWGPTDANTATIQGRYAALWQSMAPFVEDGHLSLQRFIGFYYAVIAEAGLYDTAVTSLASFLFDILDADADGRVTPAELRLFYGAYGIDPGMAQAMFVRFDKDADGILSKGEVAELVDEFFKSEDPAAPGNWLFGPF